MNHRDIGELAAQAANLPQDQTGVIRVLLDLDHAAGALQLSASLWARSVGAAAADRLGAADARDHRGHFTPAVLAEPDCAAAGEAYARVTRLVSLIHAEVTEIVERVELAGAWALPAPRGSGAEG